MAFTRDTSIVATALALLPSQWTDNADMRGVLAGLVCVFQDIEDTLAAILAQRAISAAVGSQLDGIGQILGFSRSGFSDSSYRNALIFMGQLHEGGGTVEDVFTGMATYSGGADIRKVLLSEGGAEFALELDQSISGAITPALGLMLTNGMRAARADGVYSTLQFYTEDDLFGFDDSAHGFDDATFAFGVATS